MVSSKKRYFELVRKSEEDKRPVCPDCWKGRLIWIKERRIWKCCASDTFTRCQREYRSRLK